VDSLGSVGVKTSFSYTHFDFVADGRVPAASRLYSTDSSTSTSAHRPTFSELPRPLETPSAQIRWQAIVRVKKLQSS